MPPIKPHPISSFENLKERVDRLFRTPTKRLNVRMQMSLDLPLMFSPESAIEYPTKNIAEFLDFLTDAMPDGDVYLFGGLLRDLALLGRSGFNSDIDLVVEGSWYNCVAYLESLGARRNKFGGYRLEVAGWPVDIWNAEETWAIKQGLVRYKGIASLTDTTVLNWDAILMNWRTKIFICRKNYLEEINTRLLEVVLEKNPNPLGMAVRVFRHFCLKDARKITPTAAKYLANCARTFNFSDLKNSEICSYNNSVIEPVVYRFFEYFNSDDHIDIHSQFSMASNLIKKELDLA